MATTYPFHEEVTGPLSVSPAEAFTWLDDHRQLSSHMNTRSWTMAGSSMTTQLDEQGGRAVGSHIRMQGHVLGFPLALDEVVTRREPPQFKTWETVGQPRLLVIGAYRMGFEVSPTASGSVVTIAIDYELPPRGAARMAGRLVAGAYARWCTRRMLKDAQKLSHEHGHPH